VLFFCSAIKAPSSFAITVPQGNSAGWRPLPARANSQILLYGSNCAKSPVQRSRTHRSTDGLVTIQVEGATAGAEYVVGIKYSAAELWGQSVTSPFPTVAYKLSTVVAGAPVATRLTASS